MGELASSIVVRKHDEAASPVTLFKLLLNFYASVFLLPAPPSVFEEQPTHVDCPICWARPHGNYPLVIEVKPLVIAS